MRFPRNSSENKDLPQPMGPSRREFLEAVACIGGGSLFFSGSAVSQALFPSHFGHFFVADYKSGDRMAATPSNTFRPYRSKWSKSAATTSWVQLDLGEQKHIDEVRLFPANQRLTLTTDEHYTGEGFPVRFKIETSDDPHFATSTTVADQTSADFENPGDNILSFPASATRARYLRLTVSKFAKPACQVDVAPAPEAWTPCSADGEYLFAVAKIAVVSGGKDVAIGRPVSADQVYGNSKDLAQLTREVRPDGEYIHRDHPENVTDAAHWERVSYAAHAPLTGVTLEGGLFETVMKNNIHYLLDSYTLDDLLLQFRQRAGKPIPPSTRKPDQFWEEDLAGSNAGRFLMGAGNTLRWIKDPQLQDRLNALVEGIAECQQPHGWAMAFPEDTMFYSERGAYTRAWLTHGLIEAGYSGNAKAFDLLRGTYGVFNQCEYLPNLMRGAVQGGQGMIANTRTYFTPAGTPADIQVIQRYFLEDKWLEALARKEQDQVWQYAYDRPHCYLLTNLEAYFDVYRATGDKRWHDGVKAAWEMYHDHWEQPGGSISIIEYHYDPPNSNSLTQELGENCGSTFWTLLSQRFQLISPDEERYAAEIEKSLYNVTIANQQGGKGIRYHTMLVGHKEEGTRHNSCCEGQGTRLIGSLPEHIYSIAGDGLYVNLFEPSTIQWKQDGEQMSLSMETKFPYEQEVKLTFTSDKPKAMKLRLRVPSWASAKMPVAINGKPGQAGVPGSYLVIDRTWKAGDTLTFALPAAFALKEYTGVDQIPGHKRYSLTYGPLLYAAVGPKDSILRLPGAGDPAKLVHHLTPKPDAPLHFTVAGNPGVVYMPYWQVDQQEFTCFPAIDVA